MTTEAVIAFGKRGRKTMKKDLTSWIRFFSSSQQAVLLVLAVLGVILLYERFYCAPPPPTPERQRQEFIVEVVGDGLRPGIYLFEKPPSIQDVMGKAGGRKDWNFHGSESRSQLLETGTLVSAHLEPTGAVRLRLCSMEAHKLLVFSIPINLNEASAEDLCIVPGIGPSLAQQIVAYREKRKGFSRIEDLRNVRGVGEKTYQRIRNYLTVR